MCAKRISELTAEEEKRVMDVYQKSIVIDVLTYIPTLARREYLEDMRKAGTSATHVTVTETYATPRGAFSTISGWYQMAEKEDFRFGYTADDIIQAKKEGKVCVIMGSQNAKILEDDIS